MTNTKTVHVTCPSCHAQGEFTVYKSINTKESPALKEKVRDGSLFQFACPACGAKTTVDYPFLYHQPEDHYMINYGKLEDGAKALEMLRGKGVALKDWAAPGLPREALHLRRGARRPPRRNLQVHGLLPVCGGR